MRENCALSGVLQVADHAVSSHDAAGVGSAQSGTLVLVVGRSVDGAVVHTGHIQALDGLLLGVDGTGVGVGLDAAEGAPDGGLVLDDVEGVAGQLTQQVAVLVDLIVLTGGSGVVVVGHGLLQAQSARLPLTAQPRWMAMSMCSSRLGSSSSV